MMVAIDTNILVRFLTQDDVDQGKAASLLIEDQSIFVPLTVFLETEWVLRSIYKFSAKDVSAALRAFAGLPGVSVEAPERLMVALDWTNGGMDFADALHLSAISSPDSFATFDGKLVAAARRLGVTHIYEFVTSDLT